MLKLEGRMWSIGRGGDGPETEAGRASIVADKGFAESLRRHLKGRAGVSV